jgi:hypothetical protein
MVNARVNLPTEHAAVPTTSPPVTINIPADFQPDPGFVSGKGGALNNVTFECCLGHDWSSSAADPKTWSPGEQVQITWIEKTHPAAGSAEDIMFLTARIYGPWPTVAELRSRFSPDHDHVDALSVVRWLTEFAGSATLVVTIPAHAAPGYYDLQFNAAAQEVGGCGTAACAPGFYDAAIIRVA